MEGTDMAAIKFTDTGHSYWNGTGSYQEKYNTFRTSLIPSEGKAKSLEGEVLRAASNLYYDLYNNGNANACDIIEMRKPCSTCHGEGYVDFEYDDDEEGRRTYTDVCPDCGGIGEIIDQRGKVTEEYSKYFDTIRDVLDGFCEIDSLVTDIYDAIYEMRDNKDLQAMYNKMIDIVIYWISERDL